MNNSYPPAIKNFLKASPVMMVNEINITNQDVSRLRNSFPNYSL